MLPYNKQQKQYVYICVPKFWTVQVFKNIYYSLQLWVTKAHNIHTYCPNTKLTHPNRFLILDSDQGSKNTLY